MDNVYNNLVFLLCLFLHNFDHTRKNNNLISTSNEWTVHLFFVQYVFCLLSSSFENRHSLLSNNYFTTWYKNNIVILPVKPVYSVVLRAYKNSVECNYTRLSYFVCFTHALVPCAAYFLSVSIQLYWDCSKNVLSRVPEVIFWHSLTQNTIGTFKTVYMCIGLIPSAHLTMICVSYSHWACIYFKTYIFFCLANDNF